MNTADYIERPHNPNRIFRKLPTLALGLLTIAGLVLGIGIGIAQPGQRVKAQSGAEIEEFLTAQDASEYEVARVEFQNDETVTVQYRTRWTVDGTTGAWSGWSSMAAGSTAEVERCVVPLGDDIEKVEIDGIKTGSSEVDLSVVSITNYTTSTQCGPDSQYEEWQDMALGLPATCGSFYPFEYAEVGITRATGSAGGDADKAIRVFVTWRSDGQELQGAAADLVQRGSSALFNSCGVISLKNLELVGPASACYLDPSTDDCDPTAGDVPQSAIASFTLNSNTCLSSPCNGTSSSATGHREPMPIPPAAGMGEWGKGVVHQKRVQGGSYPTIEFKAVWMVKEGGVTTAYQACTADYSQCHTITFASQRIALAKFLVPVSSNGSCDEGDDLVELYVYPTNNPAGNFNKITDVTGANGAFECSSSTP